MIKSKSPKVIVIARLEFELVYFESTTQLFIHCATGSPQFIRCCSVKTQSTSILVEVVVVVASFVVGWSS